MNTVSFLKDLVEFVKVMDRGDGRMVADVAVSNIIWLAIIGFGMDI